MTRKSRRELKRDLEDLSDEARREDAGAGGGVTVYEDPVTGKLFEGYGEDAAPVRSAPDAARVVVLTRTVSMDRAEARRQGRDVVRDLDTNTDAVVVRVPHAEHVDTEAAVELPEDTGRRPVADFTETST